MSEHQAITVRDLSKTYRIYGNPFGRLKEFLPWNDRPPTCFCARRGGS